MEPDSDDLESRLKCNEITSSKHHNIILNHFNVGNVAHTVTPATAAGAQSTKAQQVIAEHAIFDVHETMHSRAPVHVVTISSNECHISHHGS